VLRFLMIIAGCVCTTVVVSETVALIVFWQRGMVTAHHLREIRLVLTNRTVDDEKENDRDQKSEFPSSQQLAEARAIKTLNFDKRESELITLKGMADDKRDDLEALQKQFRAQRKMFEDELARIETELTSTSTEQARGVLLALPPKDAVRQLLQLTLAEDVVLLKGMPEKTVAKILKEFSAVAPAPAPPPTVDGGADRKESPAERGRRIFEALTRGEPVRTLLEQTRKDNASNPADSSD
jgi:flagellar motility protein MotE (MotC chaperone)